MAYSKKQAAAKPGLQRIRDKKKPGGSGFVKTPTDPTKKKPGGGLMRLDKPGKRTPTTRPRPGQGGPKPKPIKRGG